MFAGHLPCEKLGNIEIQEYEFFENVHLRNVQNSPSVHAQERDIGLHVHRRRTETPLIAVPVRYNYSHIYVDAVRVFHSTNTNCIQYRMCINIYYSYLR